ncbi:Pentatricopeptide repeat, partial [Arabidopsis thaliana x Arabidopsis arenosa]
GSCHEDIRTRDACGSVMPLKSLKRTKDSQPEELLCKYCSKLRKSNQYCGICKRIWHPPDDRDWVCCDGCNVWDGFMLNATTLRMSALSVVHVGQGSSHQVNGKGIQAAEPKSGSLVLIKGPTKQSFVGYDEAISLFDYFFNESQTLPNMLSCNLIIKAHCDQGSVDHALELYRHILLDGSLAPGIETYRILTKALVGAKRLDEACDLVRSMSRCDFAVYDILIRGFLDKGKFVRASQIFEELKGPNSKLPWRNYHKAIAIFNVSFMDYWFKQGKDEEAMEIFATLEHAELLNTISGNGVLKCLVEHGRKTEAWELFLDMIEICDSETVGIIMSKEGFFGEKTIPFERVRRTCYTRMIASLCQQGNMLEAEKLFADMFADVDGDDLLAGPDVSTFRAMINGYVKVGRVDDAIKTLNKMKISNLRKLSIHQAT